MIGVKGKEKKVLLGGSSCVYRARIDLFFG